MKITKAVWELLPAELKTTFAATATDPNQYDNGEENAAGLKSALALERETVKTTAQERDALKLKQDAEIAKARKEGLEEARKGGNFEAIELDYKRQLKEATEKATQASERSNALLVETANERVIGELLPSFVSPTVARAILKDMVRSEIGADGKVVTRFLDAAGQPTALDLPAFKTNLLANPELKSVIRASAGSGGGATRSDGSGGAIPENFNPTKAKPSEMVAYLEAKGVGAGAD